MPTETTEAVHNSSSQLWLVAGIPALLVIAFLLYTAFNRSSKHSSEESSADPRGTVQDSAPANSESGK